MPSVELSARQLDSIPRPETGLVRYWDTVVRGLVAHVRPTATTLYFQIDQRGKTKRVNLGRFPTVSVNKARDAARQLDYEMRFGKAKGLERREITLQDALNTYLETTRACDQHVAYVKRALEVRLEEWLSHPLSEITGAMVRKRHRELTEGGPVMADETMRAMRAVWNAARDEFEKYDIPPCPTDILRKRSGKKQAWNNPQPTRNQPIHDLADWNEAVERIINPVHQEFYRWALLTGMRKGEIARMEWEHIDRERRFLTIPKTKSGREHYLPLNDHHFAILDRLEKQGRYVFPDRTGKKPVVHPRHDEVPGTLHSLRHTWASVAAEIGIPEDQIGRILNHSNPAMSADASLKAAQGVDGQWLTYVRIWRRLRDCIRSTDSALPTAGRPACAATPREPANQRRGRQSGRASDDSGRPRERNGARSR